MKLFQGRKMFNLIEIVKKNRATFYNYSTGDKSNILLSYFLKSFIAVFFASLFIIPSNNFLNATLTISAILLGFSFNVLFYLLSSNKLFIDEEDDSIEIKLKKEKINKLSNELFYNVSYFNIITLLVILTALIFFLFDTGFSYFVLYLSELELIRSLLCNLKPYTSYISSTVLWFYRVLFYFLIIESFYSFGRAIGRMSFYFQKKIELQK